MPEREDVRVGRLILVPALITLAVTLARLAGELYGAPDSMFSRAPGGKAALVGIVWLIPVFGVYFALRLARAGLGPPSAGKAFGFGLLAFALNVVLVVAGFKVIGSQIGQNAWLGVASWIALAVARPGWPELWRVLLGYAFAVRVPVVLVAFLSIFLGWDTHYAKPRPGFPDVGSWGLFFWTAVVPQLSAWIWMTIAVGMIFGAAALAVRRPTPAP
jgi:hypothetical protein